MSNDSAYLGTKEFAARSGLPVSTVTKWLRSGKLEGKKQSGKWMIPEHQLDAVAQPASAAPSTAAAKPASGKTPPKKQKKAGSSDSFSIDEFSEMTYLTVYGVQQWLQQGRLAGIRNADGQWRVLAANLETPDIKRLVRE